MKITTKEICKVNICQGFEVRCFLLKVSSAEEQISGDKKTLDPLWRAVAPEAARAPESRCAKVKSNKSRQRQKPSS